MKHHETKIVCPFCNEGAALTTEWGWIDDDTCTAILCCAVCRTETEHADDAVAAVHLPRGKLSREECEQAAVKAVLESGLPAE